MIKSAWISALVLATGAAFASSVGAQTVNGGNYRQYARCVEVVSNGKVYSTFGPGPCPPGTKSSPSYGSYENDMAMRRTQGAVDALGQAQQSVLALADSMADRVRRESARILVNMYIDLDIRDNESSLPLYVVSTRAFPTIGDLSGSNVGGVIFSTQTGHYAECILPSLSLEKKIMGGVNVRIIAGEPACKLQEQDGAFTPTYPTVADRINGYQIVYKIATKRTGDGFSICFYNLGLTFSCKKDVVANEIAFMVGFFGDRSLTKDVVSFAGVRGDSLLFLYRPGGFPDQSRPDRVVEVTANLSESRVVKVGPYTFDVVDWSPANIVAKLVAVD